MATDVQVYRSGAYESVDFASFQIEIGISPVLVAPRATVRLSPRESITAGQSVRIQVDGNTKFEGTAESGGTKRENAPMKVPLRHDAAELFNATADVNEVGPPTDADVLNAAITNANTQASFLLDYDGTATTLANDYDVENRRVTSIFRDMVDRTGRIWWVEPDSNTIHVEAEGARGSWQTLDASSDRFAVESFDSGSVETVRNDVTVVGTGGEKVVGTASDATSQSTYGIRAVKVNVEYALTQSEADAIASSLIQADPVAEGSLRVGRNVGAIEDPQVNKTIDLTDDAKDISATGLVVEKQTIEQGRATLSVGGGVGESVSESNRAAKSDGDVTEPGTVINTNRLADDSVDTNQLVNTAVIESKLADAAVATAKLQNNAVINGKLDDLSVSETKIQDDSIATPKLQAEAVTASEIKADTITAAEIAAGTITALEIAADTITASEIAADTITAIEIAADTLTANEIDTLDLDTNQLSIGSELADQFVFEDDGTGEPVMRPTSDLTGAIGSTTQQVATIRCGRLESGSIQADGGNSWINGTASGTRIDFEGNANGNTSITPALDDDCSVGELLSAFNEMHSYAFIGAGNSSGTPEVVPQNDQTGSVGKSGQSWQSMRADNFITNSPEPVTADDRQAHSDKTPDHVDGEPEIGLDELTGASWYDPPGYVKREQRERAQGDGDGTADDHGVDLGTMSNYLLEVVKRQQGRIDEQADAIERLEQRVADLEG